MKEQRQKAGRATGVKTLPEFIFKVRVQVEHDFACPQTDFSWNSSRHSCGYTSITKRINGCNLNQLFLKGKTLFCLTLRYLFNDFRKIMLMNNCKRKFTTLQISEAKRRVNVQLLPHTLTELKQYSIE